MTSTYIGFDYGEKKIGLAVGQTLTATASPLDIINHVVMEPDWLKIAAVIKTWKPKALIIGIPLNMDGTEQAVTIKARQFAADLKKKFNLDVFEVDERLTTNEARRIHKDLFSVQNKRKPKKQVDSIAAAIILESWLETNQ